MSTALVTVGKVDDGKKGLALLAKPPPVRRLLFAAFVIPAFFVWATANVVIGFPRVGGVIPGLPKQVRIVNDLVVRNHVSASHGLRAIADSIHTGNPTRPSRSTYRSIIKAMRVPESFSSQLVD